LLNREAFERLRDNSFNSNVQPLSRYDSWARLFKRKVERAVSRSRWATSMMHTLHNTAEVRPPSVFDILRRVALLVLLQENLNDLVRQNSAHVVQPRVVVDRTALS
jgi:hypothetical protein